MSFGTLNTETGVSYGIYTMVITTQANDPTKNCAVYRTTVEHSQPSTGGVTELPLILLNNP